MQARQLHVISVLSNPIRYRSRVRLFKEYIGRMHDAGVTLWLVEAAFGERTPELEALDQKYDWLQVIRLRNDHELWQKEAMINAARRFLPPEAKYIAWQDADIGYVREEDWALETLHVLQNFPVVQTFSHAIDLGPRFEPTTTHVGFAYAYRELGMRPTKDYGHKMHPGYAWAWRRKAWDYVGGMFDCGILGSGDRHMATGLIGSAKQSLSVNVHPNYRKAVMQWQDRATTFIKGNIGYVPGTIFHYFHGLKADRKYASRWKILEKHKFDPEHDIIRDGDGLWLLRGSKPKLRDDIQAYFRARSEDHHP